ncbi:RNA polymerase sigma factor [Kibdelosporangium aridum]|uniref:RNA polymerase sigma factor n=1 Tax=Kibdelosporangium aridum TaxID=2030 RepID=UPI0035EF347B
MVDGDIRQRLAYGDHNALAEVYDLHSAAVYAVALSVTSDTTVAEDITVNVFVSLWSRPLSRISPVRRAWGAGWPCSLIDTRWNGCVTTTFPPSE